MRSQRIWWLVILALAIIIIALASILFTQPRPNEPIGTTATSTSSTTTTTTTTPASSSTQPLSARVSISSPLPGATVSHTFNVTGQAPGPWYFEAQFPVQVRDQNDNVIGRSPASAQGDWMTQALVPFTVTLQLNASYHGPATLILLKDNPSGLPENDDSISIPIVVE